MQREQPQLLESQGNGQFSGSTEQGVSFVVTARNKGTVESITVDRYQIKFFVSYFGIIDTNICVFKNKNDKVRGGCI